MIHCILFCVVCGSEDNRNTAHYPDELNPEWYVQTPAESVEITTPNVSFYTWHMAT